jgi:NTE family protein
MMAIPDANWVARFPAEWPTKELWVVASDLESGRRIVLSQNTVDQREVTLRKAVQASCAVPGLYAPVRIGGRRLVDGGVRSVTNLDLVVRSGCRAAIAFAPMGFDRREPPGYVKSAQRVRFNRQIDSEAARVRRAGMSLLVLRPSASELRHHKYNILSRSGNDRVMEAAYDATVARLATDSARRILERIKEDADIAGGRNNR